MLTFFVIFMTICDFFWIYLNPDPWSLLIPLDFLRCPGSDLPRQTSEPLHHRRPAGDAAEVLQPALHCQHGTTRRGSISRSPTSNTPVAQRGTRRTAALFKCAARVLICLVQLHFSTRGVATSLYAVASNVPARPLSNTETLSHNKTMKCFM